MGTQAAQDTHSRDERERKRVSFLGDFVCSLLLLILAHSQTLAALAPLLRAEADGEDKRGRENVCVEFSSSLSGFQRLVVYETAVRKRERERESIHA